MSRHEKHFSRPVYRRDAPKEKVLFDTSVSTRHKRSRSRSPHRRAQSPDLLQAILQGHVSEKLEVLNKNYSYVVESFKIRPESYTDPFDFSVLPTYSGNSEIAKLLEDSRKLREVARSYNTEVSDAKFKVLMAEVSVLEADTKLKAIRKELQHLSA